MFSTACKSLSTDLFRRKRERAERWRGRTSEIDQSVAKATLRELERGERSQRPAQSRAAETDRWAGSRATLLGAWIAVFALTSSGCSHARKKTVELSEMLGKKVALISVDGEDTPRRVTEVALVNQLVQHGSFDLISKQDVEAARAAHDQDPTDWIGIARRAGGDYALRAKVLVFDATEREGYSSEVVDDSQMAQEMGEDHRKTKHLFKVKSLAGKVQIRLDFAKTDPKDPDLRSGLAEAEDVVKTGTRTEAPHLPPRLSFLEKLEGKAFSKFFEQYK